MDCGQAMCFDLGFFAPFPFRTITPIEFVRPFDVMQLYINHTDVRGESAKRRNWMGGACY